MQARAIPAAATKLLGVVERSKAETMMGLQDKPKMLANKTIHNFHGVAGRSRSHVALVSGCELFRKYVTLTIGQSIIFVQTKQTAGTIHRTLQHAGYTCAVSHRAVEAAHRDATMTAFRDGQSNVLITTNVLSRGVDVDNVCLVVNYDLPVGADSCADYETFLYCIGRTSRFGRKGPAINLVADQESEQVLASIEGHFSSGDKVMIQQALAGPEALADLIEI